MIGHRPNDYHPDHRAVGQLIQDASYMVTVPFFCPDTPPLARNPVFLSYEDDFTRPNPFRADVVVSIDDVLDKKLATVEALPSQFYEGGANGGPQLMPTDEAGKARRKAEVRDSFRRRFVRTATEYRAKLRELYGDQRGDAVEAAEAFEISVRQPAQRGRDQAAVPVLRAAMIRTDAFSGHCWSEKGVGLFAKPRHHRQERLDIVEGSVKVHDAGAQREAPVHDRVRQERVAALLERDEQLAD